MVIAGGFVLRALGGAAAAGVPASGWFILCTGLLAFFLGIEKRKAELQEVDEEEETRSVLQEYSLSWLRRMESVVTASALMAYALWTLEGADKPWMLLTLPFVAYAIFRYQYLSERKSGQNPEVLLTRDTGMSISILLWAISVLIILYLA
jgi:4-hydroxybenzoate polyprenyltransferase